MITKNEPSATIDPFAPRPEETVQLQHLTDEADATAKRLWEMSRELDALESGVYDFVMRVWGDPPHCVSLGDPMRAMVGLPALLRLVSMDLREKVKDARDRYLPEKGKGE